MSAVLVVIGLMFLVPVAVVILYGAWLVLSFLILALAPFFGHTFGR